MSESNQMYSETGKLYMHELPPTQTLKKNIQKKLQKKTCQTLSKFWIQQEIVFEYQVQFPNPTNWFLKIGWFMNNYQFSWKH